MKREAVSLQHNKIMADTLKSISDDKSLSIFQAIADVNSNNGEISIKKLGLTRKQYYSIMKKLMDVGLVKKETGNGYHLTPIGTIVFNAQTKVEIAIENYWKLKALDSIITSGSLPAKDYRILVDKLIENGEVKSVLYQM